MKAFLALLLFLSFAQAQDPLFERLKLDYIGYGGGLINASGFNSGFSATSTSQRHIPKVDEHFAVQVDTGISLIAPSSNNESLQHLFLAAYGTYDYAIDDKTDIKGKAGLLFQNTSTSTSSNYNLGLSYGVQSTYKLENKQRLYIDFTVLGESISLLSAGILFYY